MNKRVWILSALTLLLLPATAWAQRPEVDCNTLPEADMQRFYELSGEMSQAVDDQNFEEALSVAKQAMAMCTSDTYTEYTLARLYDLTNDCPDAFYHYEVLSNRPDSVKKENADIYKELNKHLKNIRKKCGDAVTVEVTCPTPETRLQIASNNVDTVCPYYGKLMPGSYTVMLSKPDYVTVKETINVDPNSSGNFTMPELYEVSKQGTIRVRCPRGASKFVLTDSKGNVEEYVCPWEGKVKADTYRIYLGGTDPKAAAVVTVSANENIEHIIPAQSSSCSAMPQSQSSSFAALFAFFGIAGLAWAYRRKTAHSTNS